MSKPMVAVLAEQGTVFYHVPDDMMRYLDLNSVKRHHPELQEYIEQNSFLLQREFFQMDEKLHNP